MNARPRAVASEAATAAANFASDHVGSKSVIETLERRTLLSNNPPVFQPGSPDAEPISSTEIEIRWTDLSVNETNFWIFRSTDQMTWNRIAITPANRVSWNDTGLLPDTEYFYRIRAIALTAQSRNSVTFSETTLSLAEDPFARLDPQTGQLVVTGTTFDDLISVSEAGGTLRARLNGATEEFDADEVERIVIHGLAGNDRVSIADGVIGVRVAAGEGDDTVFGAGASDRIDGGPGNDSLKGAGGNDTITGGTGNDIIYGQDGADQLFGGAGDDKIVGGAGADSIFGEGGNDRLYGEDGLDEILGGDGRNFIAID
jgi:hypothetical protein